MIHTTQECRIGDARDLLREMPPESVDTVITSPPYHGLRDYGVDGQIGQEQSLEEYHDRLLEVTAELKRVMKPSAVLFWNHGDNYGGSGGSGGDYNAGGLREGQPKVGKSTNTTPKCLTMQNERLIMRMIDEQGWTLRNRIIWHKPNGMPSSVRDRFANKYEPVYMFSKSNNPIYYCNCKTGAIQRDKPPGTKGEEGVDWDWKDATLQDCSTGELSTEPKKTSHWQGHDYWFDLDAVRVPAKYAEVWSRKGAGKNTPYAQNNPRSRWGITRKEAKRSVNAQNTYKTTGVRDPPGGGEAPNAFHPLGKNPGDVLTVESPEDDWKQLLEVASEIVGVDTAIAIFESYMQSIAMPGNVWRIPTQPYPESHFAVFPTSLIEPMIKAACPAEICPVCGLPRERIIDREFVPQQDVSEDNGIRGANAQKPMDDSNQWQGFPRGTTSVTTAGWTSCSCGGGWIAGTVLDPFCGSGTVLEVCRLLNRNAIGLELNPDYAPLIKERSMSHTPPLTAYFGVEPGANTS